MKNEDERVHFNLSLSFSLFLSFVRYVVVVEEQKNVANNWYDDVLRLIFQLAA